MTVAPGKVVSNVLYILNHNSKHVRLKVFCSLHTSLWIKADWRLYQRDPLLAFYTCRVWKQDQATKSSRGETLKERTRGYERTHLHAHKTRFQTFKTQIKNKECFQSLFALYFSYKIYFFQMFKWYFGLKMSFPLCFELWPWFHLINIIIIFYFINILCY